MRRRLVDVGPDEVEEMLQRLLVSVRGDSESDVFDDRARGLTMNGVSLGESVLEESGDGVDIVLGHLSDILEDERERLQASVSDVQLGRSVLVQYGRDGGEGPTGLGDDGCKRGKKEASVKERADASR